MAKRGDRSSNYQLAWERRQRGWSYAELARRIRDEVVRCGEIETGLTANTVRRWEVGLRHPEPRYRKHLVTVFGKPASELGLLTPDELLQQRHSGHRTGGRLPTPAGAGHTERPPGAVVSRENTGVRLGLVKRRKAAGFTQVQLARHLGVDVSTIRRWERGVSDPSPGIRPHLAAALSVSLDELDDLLDDRTCEPTGSAGPPVFVAGRSDSTSLAVVLGASDQTPPLGKTDLDAVLALDVPSPTAVGQSELEVVRALTRALAGIENTLGGSAAAGAGTPQLRWATNLLGAVTKPRVRQDLFEAVGNLAEVVGFSIYDTVQVDTARRCFDFALRCADESGSWSLRACVLADIARVHAEAGDVDSALSAVELAQVRMDRVPATARAMLGVMRARYLAWGGRPDEARHQIDAADDWFAESDPSTDPPWLCYYDRAEHEGSAGRALIPVAVAAGRPDVAEARLRAAVRLQAPDYPRSRLFSSLRLTNLIMHTGDPDLAAAEGTQTLKLTEGIQSRRIIGELDRLHQTAQQRADVASVARLRNEIRATLADTKDLAPSKDGEDEDP